MVIHDRPVYQEEHAAQLIMTRSLHSPPKGRIHLRRSVDPLFAFPLQSDGGPYITGNWSLARLPITSAKATYPNAIRINSGISDPSTNPSRFPAESPNCSASGSAVKRRSTRCHLLLCLCPVHSTWFFYMLKPCSVSAGCDLAPGVPAALQ